MKTIGIIEETSGITINRQREREEEREIMNLSSWTKKIKFEKEYLVGKNRIIKQDRVIGEGKIE